MFLCMKKKRPSPKFIKKEKKNLFIKYDVYIIYQFYLSNNKKIIYIKDLKIVKNINKKINIWIILYNIVKIF